MSDPLSRRDFLQVTAGAGALAALPRTGILAPVLFRRHPQAPVQAAGSTSPMRWAQLTLVENDPGAVRPAVLARLLPTAQGRRRMPQRRRHRRLLSDRGSAAPPQRVRSGRAIRSARWSTGCRALGMHVIARTDPHAARDEVRAAHPDWIAVKADGQPYRHWANPELWVTCALGPYNFEFMDQRAPRDRRRPTWSTASS